MTSPVVTPNRWVLDEDSALKEKLQGFSIGNYADGSAKPVAVYFRFPDVEERDRTFPHIAIDLVNIEFAPDRAHRAFESILNFDLEQATPATGFNLVADDMPLPWNLIYQLGCYSRQPVHDRQFAMMMFQMFPEQYGSLDMTKYDGTIRRADLVSSVRRDTLDADRKRLYRQIFTISVSSEFYLNELRYVQQATQLNIEVLQPPVHPA